MNKLIITAALLALAAQFDLVTIVGDGQFSVLLTSLLFSASALLLIAIQLRPCWKNGGSKFIALLAMACVNIMLIADAIRRLSMLVALTKSR